MNNNQFVSMLQALFLNNDINQRQQATETYLKYLESNPENYMENIVHTIVNDQNLRIISLILLRKNVSRYADKSALFRTQSATIINNVLNLLMQLLPHLSDQSESNIAADCLGTIVRFIKVRVPVEPVLEFIQQSLLSNNLVLQNSASYSFQIMSDVSILDFLKYSETQTQFKLLDQIVNNSSPLVQQHGLLVMRNLIETNCYSSNCLPDQMISKFMHIIISKLAIMSSQFASCKTPFLNVMKEFVELIEVVSEVVIPYADTILQMVMAMLNQQNDESLFRHGLKCLYSLLDGTAVIPFQESQIQQLVQCFANVIFPQLANIPNDFLLTFEQTDDPMDLQDDNSLQTLILLTIERVCNKYFTEIGLQAFEIFNQHQGSWQLDYSKLLIQKGFLCCQNVQVNNYALSLLQSLESKAHDSQILFKYELTQIYQKLVFNFKQEDIIMDIFGSVSRIIEIIFQSTSPQTLIGGTRLLFECLKSDSPNIHAIFYNICITSMNFITYDNIGVKASVYQLFNRLCEILQPKYLIQLQQYIPTIITDLSIIQFLNQRFNSLQVRFLNQVVIAVSNAMVLFQSNFQNQASGIVTQFCQLFVSEYAEEIKDLIESLIKGITIIAPVYSQFIQPFLEPMIQKFVQVMQQDGSKSQLNLRDDSYDFQIDVINQQKQVKGTLAVLAKNYPSQIFPFSTQITDAMLNSQNVIVNFNFILVCDFISLLPLMALKSQIGFDEALKRCISIFDEAILSSKSRCSKEVGVMINSINNILQVAIEVQNVELIDHLVQYVSVLVALSVKSYTSWVFDLSQDCNSQADHKISSHIEDIQLNAVSNALKSFLRPLLKDTVYRGRLLEVAKKFVQSSGFGCSIADVALDFATEQSEINNICSIFFNSVLIKLRALNAVQKEALDIRQIVLEITPSESAFLVKVIAKCGLQNKTDIMELIELCNYQIDSLPSQFNYPLQEVVVMSYIQALKIEQTTEVVSLCKSSVLRYLNEFVCGSGNVMDYLFKEFAQNSTLFSIDEELRLLLIAVIINTYYDLNDEKYFTQLTVLLKQMSAEQKQLIQNIISMNAKYKIQL